MYRASVQQLLLAKVCFKTGWGGARIRPEAISGACVGPKKASGLPLGPTALQDIPLPGSWVLGFGGFRVVGFGGF